MVDNTVYSCQPSVGCEQTYEACQAREPMAFVTAPETLSYGPKTYACKATGDCLYPVHESGEIIVCDPDAPVEVGDFVAIWWRNVADYPSVKRLVTALPPRSWWHLKSSDVRIDLCVEQLNPPKQLVVSLLKVGAVHKVIYWLPVSD